VSAGGARRARHRRLHLAVIIGLVAAFGVVKLADTFNHAGLAAAAAAHHTTVNKILGGGWLLTVLVVTVIAFAVMSAIAAKRRRPARHDQPLRRRSHAGNWR
jgi:uncharacterized membrane protein